ncbi:MAG: aldehyde dehydrogenase family protein, partial [Pseudomonadota bacterium]
TRELHLGQPQNADTDIGPIIDEGQRSMLAAHIEAMEKSQTIRFAGTAPEEGTFFAPHIVELDKPSALKEEVFGPILHVVRWKAGTIDQVLEDISATGYGLTMGLHTRIESRINKVLDRLDVGNIYVNRNTIGAVVGTQPFGGSGLSGTGFKAGGPHYLCRFAQEQVVSINTAAAGGNASLMAIDDE